MKLIKTIKKNSKINISPKLKLNVDDEYIKNNKIYLNNNFMLLKLFNIKDKYLEIDKDITYNLIIPDNETLHNYEEKSNNNYSLYYNFTKYLEIQKNEVIEIDINKEGNYYFHNLSHFFINSQE